MPHCPNCFTILGGNTQAMMERIAKHPCTYCGFTSPFTSYLYTAQCVELLGHMHYSQPKPKDKEISNEEP